MVYSRPFASKAVFWAILKAGSLSSPLTVPHNRSWKQSDAILGEKSLRHWNPFKHGFHPCPSIIRNSQRRTREFLLLLESTFLPISRLATLFMHGLNTVFIFAALVMFCAFALPFWALLTAPFFGRCVLCTRCQWLCTFFHGTWLFSILLLLS